MAIEKLSMKTLGQLQELAQSAYGHGSTSAGAGRIGLIGDKVVKFNTHIGERLSKAGSKEEMLRSCDALRAHLGCMARDIYADGSFSKGMRKILKEIGLDDNGDLVKGGKSLLDRKLVARFVKQVKLDSGTEGLKVVTGGGTIKVSSFSSVKQSVQGMQKAAELPSCEQLTEEFGRSSGKVMPPKSAISADIVKTFMTMFVNLGNQILKGNLTLEETRAKLTAYVTGTFSTGRFCSLGKAQIKVFDKAKAFVEEKLGDWAKAHPEFVRQGYVNAFLREVEADASAVLIRNAFSGRNKASAARAVNNEPPSLKKCLALERDILCSSVGLARAVLHGRMTAEKALEAFRQECATASFYKQASELIVKAFAESGNVVPCPRDLADGHVAAFYGEVDRRLKACEEAFKAVRNGKLPDPVARVVEPLEKDVVKAQGSDTVKPASPRAVKKSNTTTVKPASPRAVKKSNTTDLNITLDGTEYKLTLLDNKGQGNCFFYALLGSMNPKRVNNQGAALLLRQAVHATSVNLLKEAHEQRTMGLEYRVGKTGVQYNAHCSDGKGVSSTVNLVDSALVHEPETALKNYTYMDPLDAAFVAHHLKRPVVVISDFSVYRDNPDVGAIMQTFDYDLVTGQRFPSDREPLRIYYSYGHFRTITEMKPV